MRFSRPAPNNCSAPPLPIVVLLREHAAFAGMAMLSGEGGDVASVVDRAIAGVPCKVVTPHGSGPFPVLVWVHGGGWVIGSAEESLATCRTLAAGASCIVVSVDYRLAPEHRAPAAVDDALGVTGWVLDHADQLGGDATRVAVGGDSAGGNLAALAAIEFGPRLRLQLLVYPAVDLTLSHPSITINGEGYLLTKHSMRYFRGYYLPREADWTDWRASPLLAKSLAGLPPVGVISELMNDDGTVTKGAQVTEFAKKHNLKVVTIADLIAHRQAREKLIERVATFAMESPIGPMQGYAYRSPFDTIAHVALIYNGIGDGKNVLTLSRTGQKNEAHSVVLGHNFLVSSNFINSLRLTYNKTINDRPLPEYFTATDLGSKVVSPLKGYVGVSVTGNGFAVGAGGTNPGYFNSDGYQFADDIDIIKGNHQISMGANWIHNTKGNPLVGLAQQAGAAKYFSDGLLG